MFVVEAGHEIEYGIIIDVFDFIEAQHEAGISAYDIIVAMICVIDMLQAASAGKIKMH
jgi:hypothetical protein